MPEETPETAAPAASTGFMTGKRAWIIVIALVLINIVSVVLVLSLQSRPADTDTAETGAAKGPSLGDIERNVPLDDLVLSVGTGNQQYFLSIKAIIVLGRTPEELNSSDASVVPTDAELDYIKEVVQSLVPFIRDRLNTYVDLVAPANLQGAAGKERIAREIREFTNSKLRQLDLDKARIKAGVSRDRVTDVLLTSFAPQSANNS